jgi:hypothetical protein
VYLLNDVTGYRILYPNTVSVSSPTTVRTRDVLLSVSVNMITVQEECVNWP